MQALDWKHLATCARSHDGAMHCSGAACMLLDIMFIGLITCCWWSTVVVQQAGHIFGKLNCACTYRHMYTSC